MSLVSLVSYKADGVHYLDFISCEVKLLCANDIEDMVEGEDKSYWFSYLFVCPIEVNIMKCLLSIMNSTKTFEKPLNMNRKLRNGVYSSRLIMRREIPFCKISITKMINHKMIRFGFKYYRVALDGEIQRSRHLCIRKLLLFKQSGRGFDEIEDKYDYRSGENFLNRVIKDKEHVRAKYEDIWKCTTGRLKKKNCEVPIIINSEELADTLIEWFRGDFIA